MSIWRWQEWLAAVPDSARITLGEGQTPLVRSRRLGPELGLEKLYFKLENANPTGSYKDRFAAAAVAHAIAAGARTIVATSSGNTGAAVAACAAVAGVTCRIAVVETAPWGKLKQMMAYGAEIVRVRAFGNDPDVTRDVLERLALLSQRADAQLVVSAYAYCPQGMTGVETIGFELTEQLSEPLEHVFCPAGSGGLCVAVARGLQRLVDVNRIPQTARVECVQPVGNDTIATPLRQGAERARDVTCTSQISGLQVAHVIDGHLALAACRASGGTGHVVTDAAVWEAQRRLAREEGIFAEPAGAASVAAALQAAARHELPANRPVVCVISGSGFKDEPSVDRMIGADACAMVDPADLAGW